MSNYFNVVWTLITIFACINGICQRYELMPSIFDQITAERDKILEPTWNSHEGDNFIPEFGPMIKNICEQMPEELIRKTEKDERKVLGIGSYGRVFAATLVDKSFAIKQFSFDDYIKDRLITELEGSFEENLACIESVLLAAKAKDLFVEKRPAKVEDEQLVTAEQEIDHIKSLKPFNLQFLQTTECELIEGSQEAVQYRVQKYFDTINHESSLMQRLTPTIMIEKFAGREPSFPELEFCLVDKNLDIYFGMQKLDYTLEDVINNCPFVFYSQSVEKRIKIYLQIFHQIFVLHKKKLTHCDIKPKNIAFKNDSYESILVIDFGFVVSGPCKGTTPDYEPIEAHEKKALKDEQDPLTGTEQYLKHDAFSLGMVMLASEVGLASLDTLHEEYVILKKSDDLSFEEKENWFYLIVQKLIRDESKHRFPGKSREDTDRLFQIDQRIFDLITSLLKWDYKQRLSVKAALNQLYQLFLAAIDSEKALPEPIEERLKKFEKFKTELQSNVWLNQVPVCFKPSSAQKII